MKSVVYTIGRRGSSSSPEYRPLFGDAERLVRRHGEEADLAAARLADDSFSAGDDIAGNRWTKIFRILSACHIRRVERLGNGA